MLLIEMWGDIRWPVGEHRWLFSILHPQYRFLDMDGGPVRMMVTNWTALGWCLQREYERQIRAELIEPEWPSEYWERIEDLRGDCGN